ncbi:hypothetical protein [Nocardioides aquiterrae]
MHAYRRAAAGAAALVAVAAALSVTAAPADAADPCYSEAQPTTGPPLDLPTGPGCDDTVPPETSIDSSPVVGGWLRATSVSITFSGRHPDADSDPISYECQFFNSVSTPTTWQSCTSPFSRDGLDENTATPYTFRVRAVDTPDNAHDLTTDAWYPASADAPDYDQRPAELSFTADATAPNTFGFLRTTYADDSGFDGPMLVANSAQVRLQSSQGTTYRCTLNRKDVACNDGLTTLRPLGAGWKRFEAAAVDPAGNVDPSPFVEEFFVPRNLALGNAPRASRGDWRRFRDPGAFGGDYLESARYGAMLSFPVRNVREIRLLAPAGPQLGRVEIRVGRGQWYRVNLSSSDPQKLKVYAVRGALSGLLAGTLQVRVASHGKPVRVDAISAR